MADMENLLESIWVEKYRPRELDEVVLEDHAREFFSRCIGKGEIPHLLLSGVQGSGKTTTAQILVDHIIKNEMDLLPMNGSALTGVDHVRTVVTEFLKTPAFASKIKIVFIDEFDHMSPQAQACLRSIMEVYIKTGRFICTCNIDQKLFQL